MIRIFKYFLCLIIASTPIISADYNLISDLGTSAEMIAIGNIEGFSKSSTSLFENPASLGNVKNVSLSAFHTKIINEVDYNNFVLAVKKENRTFAIGTMRASVGGIPVSTKINNEVEYANADFSYQANITKLGFHKQINPTLDIGFSGTMYSNKTLNLSSRGFNLDAGLLYTHELGTLSVTGKNLLFKHNVLYSSGEEESIPSQVVVSGKIPLDRSQIFLQSKVLRNSPFLFSAGTKYWTKNKKAYVAAGFKQVRVLNTVKNNTSLGLGVELHKINLYMAFEKSEYVDQDNHYFFSASLEL